VLLLTRHHTLDHGSGGLLALSLMTTSLIQLVDAEVIENDLTAQEAQQIVNSIKQDIGTLRGRVYALWARKGWQALGYQSWEAFCAGEFPELNDRTLRKYVNAEQVQRLVSPRTGPSGPELPEWALRPLVQFKDDPSLVKALWAEAMKRKPADRDFPSGPLVEQVVAEYKSKQDEQAWPADQMRRRRIVEAGGTVVANQHVNSPDAILIRWASENGCLVNINRGTPWGNPFVLPDDGDRDTVCDSFEIYFGRKFSLHDRVVGLKGKVLACWCYPERCHGDFLVSRTQEG
jgi:hypothetical protein